MSGQRLLKLCVAASFACSVSAAEPETACKLNPERTSPEGAPKAPKTEPNSPLPTDETAPRTIPPQLFPDEITPGKTPAPTKPPLAENPKAAKKQQSPGMELDLRIRYRKARNIAETSGQVQEAWLSSRQATTDQQKRTALLRYYSALFARMLTVDRGIKPLVEKAHKEKISSLTQLRIAPSAIPD